MTSLKIAGGKVTKEMNWEMYFIWKATHYARKKARFARKENMPRESTSQRSKDVTGRQG